MMEKGPKFSSIPPSAMLRWASQWERAREEVWWNLEPQEVRGVYSVRDALGMEDRKKRPLSFGEQRAPGYG